MITKDELKSFYYLYEAIRNTEGDIIPSKYIEGGWITFEKINEKFWDTYHLFDEDKEYPILGWLIDLWDSKFTYDTDLLIPKDKKKFTKKYVNGEFTFKDGISKGGESEGIFITTEFREQCGYTKVEFKTLDEAIDFIFDKMKLGKKI